MNEFHSKHPDYVHYVRWSPIELARTIAKIAYSRTIADFGYGSFDPLPHILDIILCHTDDVGYAVGGDMELHAPIEDAGHITTFRFIIWPARPPHIIADIRLFASTHTPDFHAVVGTFNLQNEQHLRTFCEKVKDA